jgi:hypothetical protein
MSQHEKMEAVATFAALYREWRRTELDDGRRQPTSDDCMRSGYSTRLANAIYHIRDKLEEMEPKPTNVGVDTFSDQDRRLFVETFDLAGVAVSVVDEEEGWPSCKVIKHLRERCIP